LTRPAGTQLIGELPAGTPVAFEAAYGWGWLVELLEDYRCGSGPAPGAPAAVQGDRLAGFSTFCIKPSSSPTIRRTSAGSAVR
jgi:hypothetical protein